MPIGSGRKGKLSFNIPYVLMSTFTPVSEVSAAEVWAHSHTNQRKTIICSFPHSSWPLGVSPANTHSLSMLPLHPCPAQCADALGGEGSKRMILTYFFAMCRPSSSCCIAYWQQYLFWRIVVEHLAWFSVCYKDDKLISDEYMINSCYLSYRVLGAD